MCRALIFSSLFDGTLSFLQLVLPPSSSDGRGKLCCIQMHCMTPHTQARTRIPGGQDCIYITQRAEGMTDYSSTAVFLYPKGDSYTAVIY